MGVSEYGGLILKWSSNNWDLGSRLFSDPHRTEYRLLCMSFDSCPRTIDLQRAREHSKLFQFFRI